MDWDFIGQEWAVSLLKKHIIRGTARQAYLFTGPQGIGRCTLALRFAQAINCQDPPTPGDACGACRACKGFLKSEHTDLSILERDPDRTRILIEQIRGLQHTLALSPYESKYRIALLINFHEATEDAQNALLKLLEEPPDRVILLLTAESAESLLPTISSRCEQLRLRPLKPVKLAESLEKIEGLKTAPVEQLAHISGGCPGRAIELGRSGDLFRKRREHIGVGLDLLHAGIVERFSYAEKTARRNEKMNQNRDELKLVLQAWTSLWRDIYLASSGVDLYITNIDFSNEIKSISAVVNAVDALACLKELNSGLWKLENNANLRLLMEIILLGWPELEKQV